MRTLIALIVASSLALPAPASAGIAPGLTSATPDLAVEQASAAARWANAGARMRDWAEAAERMRAEAATVRPTPRAPSARPATPKAAPVRSGGGSGLEAIAACESGGNPRAVSPNGQYRGLLQFDRQTWASVGGTGDPAAASPEEQYRRGAILQQQRGNQPWPVCGRR